MIPYGKQYISDSDIQAVLEVLKSDYLTQGPVVPKFEESVSSYCDVKYAVAVNSATSALHISCLALGVKPNDIVWTSPISFVASSNCALYCGAKVDFVDIDSKTYNLSPDALSEKLIKAEKDGKLPKVVIPVHLAGQSCDMEKIHKLSMKYGFKIIEDASHAIGGKYQKKAVGNCQYSDISVFSFHPVKIITTGEGGMALTNDEEIASKLTRLRSHGIVRHPSEMDCKPDGLWYYQQTGLGYNYRMTDIHAALGLSQMSMLDEFVQKRNDIAKRYDKILSEYFWIETPMQNEASYSTYHLYIIRVKKNDKIISHGQLFERFRNSGIFVNLHYIPIYRQPYYKKMGFKAEDFPNSEDYYAEAISLPIFYSLDENQQDEVINIIKRPFGFQNLF